MSNLSQFLGGGGGGLTPKFQEFTSSGTFTPSQALIDAGGYIEVFLVGGGAKSANYKVGGAGGETILTRMTLTSTSAITVAIAGSSSGNGGTSVFNGSTAGGFDLNATGGSNIGEQGNKLGAGWGAVVGWNAGNGTSAGCGFLGYGAGGSMASTDVYSNQGGVLTAKANSGQGAPSNSGNGASGYCLVKWYE